MNEANADILLCSLASLCQIRILKNCNHYYYILDSFEIDTRNNMLIFKNVYFLCICAIKAHEIWHMADFIDSEWLLLHVSLLRHLEENSPPSQHTFIPEW